MTKVHTFADSHEAYDASQTRDNIEDGDVLSVPSEHVIGVLVGAWPVAVTEQRGQFHRLAAGVTWENLEDGRRYLESARVAFEQTGESTLYVCEIALEFIAESPEAAVRKAEQLLDDPVNRGFVWTVRNTDTNEARDIDASEL